MGCSNVEGCSFYFVRDFLFMACLIVVCMCVFVCLRGKSQLAAGALMRALLHWLFAV